jgi:effector-binding domain-containing protein
MESVPVPNDGRVRIHELPERRMAVIRFRGWAREKSVDRQKATLISVLQKNGVETIGEPFLMRYNSPWTPGIVRRNEIGIEIVE